MKANAPYKKEYKDGILQNPITKENPYLFPVQLKLAQKGFRFWSTVRNKFFTGKTIVNL